MMIIIIIRSLCLVFSSLSEVKISIVLADKRRGEEEKAKVQPREAQVALHALSDACLMLVCLSLFLAIFFGEGGFYPPLLTGFPL